MVGVHSSPGPKQLPNGQRSLPRGPTECIILDSWIFDSSISFDELYAKAACLFIDNILCGKLVSSEPIMTNDNLTVTLVGFFFLMFYQIFLSPQVKKSMISSNKDGSYELPYELPKDLVLSILEN